jgi:hypothetical protein
VSSSPYRSMIATWLSVNLDAFIENFSPSAEAMNL